MENQHFYALSKKVNHRTQGPYPTVNLLISVALISNILWSEHMFFSMFDDEKESVPLFIDVMEWLVIKSKLYPIIQT